MARSDHSTDAPPRLTMVRGIAFSAIFGIIFAFSMTIATDSGTESRIVSSQNVRLESLRPEAGLTPNEDEILLDISISYEEHLNFLVNRMSLISEDLMNYPSRLNDLISSARQTRLETYLFLKELKENALPMMDRANGDFSPEEGTIGHSLAVAVAEAEAASVSLYTALHLDESCSRFSLQQFKRHLDAAQNAAHSLLSGINNHARKRNLGVQAKIYP